jgi:peptidoglycan hydrolase-like protein with peptidoglycan-binding domain
MAALLATSAYADALTEIIQTDLTTLGIYSGEIDGEATTATIVAVSKFQAENGMEVTGEITPQLAGVIKAAIGKRGQGAPVAQAATSAMPAQAAAQHQMSLQEAQQACLQQKVADAQASQQKKRGLGSLMRAVGRTASRLGGGDTAAAVAQASSDIYTAGAVAADLESAARDLGITESDIETCRSPQ